MQLGNIAILAKLVLHSQFFPTVAESRELNRKMNWNKRKWVNFLKQRSLQRTTPRCETRLKPFIGNMKHFRSLLYKRKFRYLLKWIQCSKCFGTLVTPTISLLLKLVKVNLQSYLLSTLI